MRTFGIVPKQPLDQFLLKRLGINQKQVFMPVHELFLDGTVKAFDMRILFGTAGIGVEVYDTQFFQVLPEVFLKLGTVVRLYMRDDKRCYRTQFFHKIFRIGTDGRLVYFGIRKPTIDINGGDDIPAYVVHKQYDRVYFNQSTGFSCSMSFSSLFLGFLWYFSFIVHTFAERQLGMVW